MSTIFKKYYSFNVGTMGFAVNFAITVFGAALFGIELAILTLISMFLDAKVTDLVVEGINTPNCKGLPIVWSIEL